MVTQHSTEESNAPPQEPVYMFVADYNRLPDYFRRADGGLQVMATVGGRQVFVPVSLH